MKYYAKLSDKEHVIEIDNNEAGISVFLDGNHQRVELQRIGESNLYSLIADNKSHQLFIEKKQDGYLISINGHKYRVTIEDEKSRLLRSLIKTDAAQHGPIEVKSPMPGLIVRINVAEGQEIQKDDSLVIIEAMKMENEIRANSNGVVKKLLIKEGDSVDKGAALMMIIE